MQSSRASFHNCFGLPLLQKNVVKGELFRTLRGTSNLRAVLVQNAGDVRYDGNKQEIVYHHKSRVYRSFQASRTVRRAARSLILQCQIHE